jgi:hypothetical protein
VPVGRPALPTRPRAQNPIEAHDRAMLLPGFSAALRLSKLSRLCLGDVATVPGRGLRVLV